MGCFFLASCQVILNCLLVVVDVVGCRLRFCAITLKGWGVLFPWAVVLVTCITPLPPLRPWSSALSNPHRVPWGWWHAWAGFLHTPWSHFSDPLLSGTHHSLGSFIWLPSSLQGKAAKTWDSNCAGPFLQVLAPLHFLLWFTGQTACAGHFLQVLAPLHFPTVVHWAQSAGHCCLYADQNL